MLGTALKYSSKISKTYLINVLLILGLIIRAYSFIAIFLTNFDAEAI